MEHWKNIKGYEGLYAVSDMGRIKSLKRISNGRHYPESIKNHRFDKKGGHLCVTLCKNGIKKTPKVHRLVAIAFLKNPHNLPMVNHEDGNKSNNNVHNLKWCDQSYNELHARKTGLKKGLFGEQHPSSKLNKQIVIEIRKSEMPINLLAKKFGVSTRTIGKVLSGITWKHV
jgi:hypothetical protein